MEVIRKLINESNSMWTFSESAVKSAWMRSETKVTPKWSRNEIEVGSRWTQREFQVSIIVIIYVRSFWKLWFGKLSSKMPLQSPLEPKPGSLRDFWLKWDPSDIEVNLKWNRCGTDLTWKRIGTGFEVKPNWTRSEASVSSEFNLFKI